jgi:hypothetical protein
LRPSVFSAPTPAKVQIEALHHRRDPRLVVTFEMQLDAGERKLEGADAKWSLFAEPDFHSARSRIDRRPITGNLKGIRPERIRERAEELAPADAHRANDLGGATHFTPPTMSGERAGTSPDPSAVAP